MTLLLALLVGSGYGYGPDQDPFVLAFKRVAASARDGRWEEAQRGLQDLEPAVDELERAFEVDRGAQLRAAIARRSRAALAEELTALAYLEIALKLRSTREDLQSYYPSKYRVEAARGYYLEMLAPAVRALDAQRSTSRHATLLATFDEARAALGSPGFLGRGRAQPEAARFAAAAAAIERTLREAFPSLARSGLPQSEVPP